MAIPDKETDGPGAEGDSGAPNNVCRGVSPPEVDGAVTIVATRTKRARDGEKHQLRACHRACLAGLASGRWLSIESGAGVHVPAECLVNGDTSQGDGKSEGRRETATRCVEAGIATVSIP